MRIEPDLSSRDWDNAIVGLGGHPWQSALWGDARRDVDGIVDHRWLVRSGRDILQMLRFEERRIPGLGRVAWIPRGPVMPAGTAAKPLLSSDVRDRLKQYGFMLAVASPWRRRPDSDESAPADVRCPRTIWLDLTLGKDRLWRNLSQQWRRNVGLARRENVVVETTSEPTLINEYFDLCRRISEMKQFELRTSPALIQRLLRAQTIPDVEARLFVARCSGRVGAGALAFRCGPSVHYFGGASDRAFTKQHPGEAVHWSIVEWGLSRGCRCYDLEGIDPHGNPGTYAFKKKMGGDEVALFGRQVEALDLKGQLLAPVASYALESRWAALPSLVRSVWAQRRSSPQHSTPARSGERVARTS